MTLATRITHWLPTEDYSTGLALLEETGYSGFLLGLLQRGENAYNRQKLTQLLTQWQPPKPGSPVVANESLVKQPSPGHANPATTANPGGAVTKTEQSSVALPSDGLACPGVSELKQQSYQLLDERAELKARIRTTLDDTTEEADAKRAPWALRIKAIGRALDEIYSRLAFQKTNGYLPLQTNPAVEIDDRAALLNARSYVSRYRKKLQDDCLTSEQRHSAQRLLEQYTLEKNRLEQKSKPNTG